MDEIRYLSLCGLLGYGYAPQSLSAALEKDLHFIGVDGGSTDPGPYYLGSGAGFVKPMQVKRDLALVLPEALKRRIPLIIGSAGGSGARPHVEATLAILREIAREKNLRFRTAVIYTDLDASDLNGKTLYSCGGSPEFDPAVIPLLRHPVAQVGTEPLIEALSCDVDVIVSGRCCDTAVFAAYPISRGFPPGLALHAAKIAECGALCARPVGANDSLVVTLRHDSFTVEPPNPIRRCTPDSVAAHSLYEQPDPECFYEPEGKIDMSDCSFEQDGERAVTVRGTRLIPAPEPTLKLEGAAFRGYRAISIAEIRDPAALAEFDALRQGVFEAVAGNLGTDGYTLRFLKYGGGESSAGVVIEAVAPTQELADTVVSLARSSALHQAFPNRKATAGNLAFPFSPSDFRGGEVYEFALYHLIRREELKRDFHPVIIEK